MAVIKRVVAHEKSFEQVKFYPDKKLALEKLFYPV
jgi:hypothetical protein